MAEKQNLSHMRRKKQKKNLDPCPVCEENLYHDENFTKRIGIMNDLDKIDAWMCPYCRATFDKMDNLMYITGVDSMQGKA
jgi:uncharacterized protein with PIN domain